MRNAGGSCQYTFLYERPALPLHFSMCLGTCSIHVANNSGSRKKALQVSSSRVPGRVNLHSIAHSALTQLKISGDSPETPIACA
eukprot:5425418-Pyramimonas_sp.AAC.1